MKILVLNLPYRRKIIRKYSCSYYANGYLYPPIELIRICTIIKEKAILKHDIIFFDAIAENKKQNFCKRMIMDIKPDVIITLSSLDFVNEEIEFLTSIKNTKPFVTVLIGYLPDLFPEIFENVDIILGNDFEAIIEKTFIELISDNSNDFINLIKKNKSLKLKFNPDIIIKHDNSIIKKNQYSELFVKGETAFTYFSFGCPYKCTFCIKTYNLQNGYFRSYENIVIELEDYWKSGIRNIRVLDDNCTLNKTLLNDILAFQKKNKIQFNYYGLTRIDLLDNETINLLISLNFKSLMIGIETINLVSQNEYNKEFDLDFSNMKSKLQLLSDNKIEIVFFMLFNPITETNTDIKKTLKFLKKLPIHFATLSFLTPYPGTKYFQNNKSNIDFKSKPIYSSTLKKEYYKKIWQKEIYFMFSFFVLKPSNLMFLFAKLFKHPLVFSKIAFNLFKTVFYTGNDRKDYI